MNTWRNWERGWILLGAFLALSVVLVLADEAYVPDLRGHWVSAGCESIASPDGGISRLKRDYVIGDDSWHLDLTFFEDQACSKKLFALGIDGQYALGAKSLEVTGATEGRFALERVKLTPYTDEMSALFGQGGCGNGPWMTGTGQDVSKRGCMKGVPSVASCPAEYDLVRRDGDTLRFGDRSYTLCEPGVYPSKLGAAPLLKQE